MKKLEEMLKKAQNLDSSELVFGEPQIPASPDLPKPLETAEN